LTLILELTQFISRNMVYKRPLAPVYRDLKTMFRNSYVRIPKTVEISHTTAQTTYPDNVYLAVYNAQT